MASQLGALLHAHPLAAFITAAAGGAVWVLRGPQRVTTAASLAGFAVAAVVIFGFAFGPGGGGG